MRRIAWEAAVAEMSDRIKAEGCDGAAEEQSSMPATRWWDKTMTERGTWRESLGTR